MSPHRIRNADIAAIQEKLENVPAYEAETLTKRAAIVRLMPQISALRAKGYTLQVIAEQLTAHGVPIHRALLQKYLKELASAPPLRKRRNASVSVSESAPPLPSSSSPNSSPGRIVAAPAEESPRATIGSPKREPTPRRDL